MSAFATSAASWQNLYLLLGTGAATLIGLMFIAITFGASLVDESTTDSVRSFLDPTLNHFIQVFLTSALVLVPSMTPTIFGVLLGALSIYRLVSLVRIHRHMKEAHERHGDIELSDWIAGIIIPVVAHVGLLATSIAFVLGHIALTAITIVTLVVLVTGIYNAWELMLWLALTRSKRNQ